MYTKCFSTLRCCGWACGCTHPYTVTPVQVGVDFWKMAAWLSQSGEMMSWLRLQTRIDCIPQPWHIYATCLSSLRCCGWAYGCILIAVLHVQVGVNFRGNGVWPSLYDVAVSWLRLQTPIDCIPQPWHIYATCLSSLRCFGWAYGCILIAVPYYMCSWG
jgi:hypothetical protein